MKRMLDCLKPMIDRYISLHLRRNFYDVNEPSKAEDRSYTVFKIYLISIGHERVPHESLTTSFVLLENLIESTAISIVCIWGSLNTVYFIII